MNTDESNSSQKEPVFTEISFPQKKKVRLAAVIHTSKGKLEILNGCDPDLLETILKCL